MTTISSRGPSQTRQSAPAVSVSRKRDGDESPLADVLTHPLSNYYLVMVASLLLVAIGLMMVLSSSSAYAKASGYSSYYYLQKQLVFLALGIPVAAVLSRCNQKALKAFGWIGIIASIVMLLLVVAPGLGLGVEVNGNRAWLNLGFTTVQPSEFAKAGLVLWSAAVLSNRSRTLDQPKRLLFPLLLVMGTVLLLVLAERDLGTALVVGLICFAILWFVGTPAKVLTLMGGVAAAGVGVLILTSPERMARIRAFLGHGEASGASTSDQPLNAIYALASGGWWGVGLGSGRQKWGGLYNGAYTDYVFAVLGEELGLLGTLSVIALFLALGFAGIRIAMRSGSLFGQIAAGGMTAWLVGQALINICVAMGLLPVLGVPLPFISYGGSALLANLMAVGVLLALARQEPEARAALSRKPLERPRVTGVVAATR